MEKMSVRIRRIIEEVEGRHESYGARTRFAEKIGVSKGNVSDWLNETTRPGRKIQEKICQLYGVSPAWLSVGSGPMLEKELPKEFITPKDENVLSTIGKIEEIKRSLEDVKNFIERQAPNRKKLEDLLNDTINATVQQTIKALKTKTERDAVQRIGETLSTNVKENLKYWYDQYKIVSM